MSIDYLFIVISLPLKRLLVLIETKNFSFFGKRLLKMEEEIKEVATNKIKPPSLLPSKIFVNIEFPGVIQNVENALTCLGGREALAQVNSYSKIFGIIILIFKLFFSKRNFLKIRKIWKLDFVLMILLLDQLLEIKSMTT